MGIPVTYLGTLTRELRNLQERETMRMTDRRDGQTSRR